MQGRVVEFQGSTHASVACVLLALGLPLCKRGIEGDLLLLYFADW